MSYLCFNNKTENIKSILTKFELTSKDGTGEALHTFLSDILPDTRNYNGCTGASFGIAQDDTKTVLLIEEWDSVPEFEAYLNWRIERGDFETLSSLLAAEPNVTHFERG